ncbi:3-hydroxyacyl-CoA dehydrogenase NAD-binding domain-containing protein [Nocardioides sp. BP30]|uniref:3-hydroxyacyl-CoA dehydrogenase NAD-binding domain-containing protein n=1 Tax=Nocardioides sp. BP30 TaxID=3036374 RepID=UPI00246928A6|nr:3-hydroxyacyl-CoA dehydrogenase NAD-binding domain-containing protein [Nocardioides sp. BP30]WGL51228.1 3-hydroxyacyl-CoA dehydrogenase NAD-binding domain-containing protein [Nocardioides sp. BP30]
MTETSPELIAQTLLYPYLNHAVKFLQDEYATAADIDNGMRFGCGYPTGPLAQLDAIGPAVVRDALAARFAQTGDSLHRPVALLDRIADEGGAFHAATGVTEAAAPEFKRVISRIGVVGTGTMAAGIAQVFAQAGYDVVFVGRGQDKVDGVVGYVAKNLDRAIAKGKATEADKQAVLGRLTGATERAALAEADLVVEAIAEDLTVKTELFADLDALLKPGAILATTTSSLPITRLAAATRRPHDVIGMHFFNPAPVMKLVEIVTTPQTGADVDETVRALTSAVGKVGVSCGDRAGFIVNALLFPYLNDAVKLAETGVGIDVIDRAVKEQVALPMGPFELLDVVGNDVSLAIQRELHAEFKEPGLAPAALLVAKVADGKLGRKTGEGFHSY